MSSHVGTTTEREFEWWIEGKRGLPRYWPGCYAYKLKNGLLRIELTGPKSGKKELRGLDPWGLAVAVEAMASGREVSSISFVIGEDVDVARPGFEALKRRVSFLAINNKSLRFELVHAGCRQFEQSLYSKEELFNRPLEEVAREGVRDRNNRNKEGRLEKDFQTWLFGRGKRRTAKRKGKRIPIRRERTNERLAVLGEDFLRLKKKRLGIMREFPTGAFKGEVTEENRILPTDYVDMVTLNKDGILSVIELKVDDSPLEVISQILDYSLYFRCYAEQLRESSLKNLWDGRSNEIACYVAANHFHPRFDGIAEFYSTQGKEYGFAINKVILGYATELGHHRQGH